MDHLIDTRLVSGTVSVAVIGCGGTGSRVATALMELHTALVARGHPGGLDVTLIDPDHVSMANVGRQAFFPADVGRYKAEVLAQRALLCFNYEWKYCNQYVSASDHLNYDLVIGCVDTRKARRAILRALERARAGGGYWLDFGNRAADGQAILGQVSKDARKQVHPEKLPHVAELFPEIIDEAGDEADDAPSCSLVEALERQDLFVNRTVVDHGMNLLWQLFRYGKISHHGVFVNVASHRVTPLPVDPQAWARYGYHAGQRIITPRKTGKKHKAVNDDHHRHAA